MTFYMVGNILAMTFRRYQLTVNPWNDNEYYYNGTIGTIWQWQWLLMGQLKQNQILTQPKKIQSRTPLHTCLEAWKWNTRKTPPKSYGVRLKTKPKLSHIQERGSIISFFGICLFREIGRIAKIGSTVAVNSENGNKGGFKYQLSSQLSTQPLKILATI